MGSSTGSRGWGQDVVKKIFEVGLKRGAGVDLRDKGLLGKSYPEKIHHHE